MKIRSRSLFISSCTSTLCRRFATASAVAKKVTPRSTDFSAWYHDVVAAAELIDTAPVKGCVILRPGGYGIWEAIQRLLDDRIKAKGHKNAYFPLLVPASFLGREAQHVEGFAKECAVVTHSRLRTSAAHDGAVAVEPDPSSKLHEPLVVRPTSETVIWDAFSRWVTSHRDLPLLINQWANVVRWEMRTRPFLRTSEFLWQEGHTAHATEQEARAHAWMMALLYRDFCRDVLAVPVVLGRKSATERFAGADETLTCEAMMQNGWALQSATSHYLAQTFSKAFDVRYMSETGARLHPWGTSWGASTRLIGAVIMTHSDDVGLVLPPAVAPTQVVVVPLLPKAPKSGGAAAVSSAAEPAALGAGDAVSASADAVMSAARGAADALRAAGLRVELCTDVHSPPGGRYYAWERRGVPLRVEVGSREVAAGCVSAVPRVKGVARCPITLGDGFTASVRRLLDDVHAALLSAAEARLASGTVRSIASYAQFLELAAKSSSVPAAVAAEHSDADGRLLPQSTALAAASSVNGAGSVSPFVLAPWHDDAAAEAQVKSDTSFTIRCFPLGPSEALSVGEAPAPLAVPAGSVCFFSGKPATHMALFARAY